METDMRIRIGAMVKTRQGEEVGKVERVVLEPSSNEVDAVVVHRGLILSRDVLIPISLVQEATEAEVLLRIGRDRLRELPDFVSAHFEIRPPEDALSYASYAPGSILFPLVPPYGVPGEPGPYELAEATGETAIVPIDLAIVRGMPVLSLDGTVGEVEEVRTDPLTDRATAIVVRGKAGLKEQVEIPIEFVSAILYDHIKLSLTNQQVEELPEPVADRYIVSEKKRGKGKK